MPAPEQEPASRADQAQGLRQRRNPRPVKVITVTGGKGGVGKTNIAANLSVALSMLGRRVMLLDADLGLANVDVMFGLQPHHNLADVIRGERSLNEIIVNGPAGVMVVPGASGISDMADLTPAHHAGLISAFSELTHDLDTLIVDTAAGISDGVLRFAEAAHETLVVVCDEPTSITDSPTRSSSCSVPSVAFRHVSAYVTNMTRQRRRRERSCSRSCRALPTSFLDGHSRSCRQYSVRRARLARRAATDAVRHGVSDQPQPPNALKTTRASRRPVGRTPQRRAGQHRVLHGTAVAGCPATTTPTRSRAIRRMRASTPICRLTGRAVAGCVLDRAAMRRSSSESRRIMLGRLPRRHRDGRPRCRSA